MNTTLQARAAYGAAPLTLRTGRSAEYQVFAEVTARLRAASNAAQADFPRLVAAVHDNRRLWTHLAADVADADNALPQALRAQIFYLAEFTDHQSQRILRGEASAAALIDINLAIMRGLTDGQLAHGVA